MEASVRAVEAYRRSRMVDSVTTEDDKIAAVYRLEEVCSTLRSAPSDVVKEMVLYIMKRLEHKSPVVKQKVLRLIKFAAPKGGPDFKREMQRQGGTVRQLVHYRGQMDALKGDSLNKAVRETAQEALSALFAEDRQGVVQEEAGAAGRRIQGFGNTPVDRPPFDDTPKTILGGMIGFGSASLMKGINMVTGGQGDVPSGYMSSSGGSHRGPTTGLRRSLTAERERDRDRDKYDKYDPKEVAGAPESEDPRASTSERAVKVSGGREGSTERRASTQEERLLDTITAAGGVRLHPTRDALQAFLTDAAKLDALNLCNALEKKLQAHSWQVRLKAMCVLEALLRQREVKTFGKVAELFEDDGSIVNECLKSPQMSLREKTKKVLDLLGVSQDGSGSEDGRGVNLKLPPPPPPPGGGGGGVAAAVPAPVVAAALPDLLDTDDWDFSGNADATKDESAVRDELQQKQADVAEQSDILGSSDWSATFQNDADLEGSDPFAGMAVHPVKDANPEPAVPDLFAGMEAADGRSSVNGAASGLESKDDDGLFAGLSLNSTESAAGRPEAVDGLANLMAGLATNGAQNGSSPLDQFHTNQPKQQTQPSLSGISGGFPSNLPGLPVLPHANMAVPNYAAGAVLQQQLMLMNMYSRGIPRPFAPGPNPMLQQGFIPGFVPLGGMNAAFPPQQVTGGLSGLSGAGNVGGLVNSHGPGLSNMYSDSFDFSSDPVPRNSGPVETPKEETKAFDFISDHLSTLRAPRK